MPQVFISYVEEDGEIAAMLARDLEAAGYTTWYYQEHSLPGISYLDQILTAIEQAVVVVVLLSTGSLRSSQMNIEIVRSHETEKVFVPLLKGITYTEFRDARRNWALVMGGAVALPLPSEGVGQVIPRVLTTLRVLGIPPEREVEGAPPPGAPARIDDAVLPAAGVATVEATKARDGRAGGIAQRAAAATPPIEEIDRAAFVASEAAAFDERLRTVPVAAEVAAATNRSSPGWRNPTIFAWTGIALVTLGGVGLVLLALRTEPKRSEAERTVEMPAAAASPEPPGAGPKPGAPQAEGATSDSLPSDRPEEVKTFIDTLSASAKQKPDDEAAWLRLAQVTHRKTSPTSIDAMRGRRDSSSRRARRRGPGAALAHGDALLRWTTPAYVADLRASGVTRVSHPPRLQRLSP